MSSEFGPYLHIWGDLLLWRIGREEKKIYSYSKNLQFLVEGYFPKFVIIAVSYM